MRPTEPALLPGLVHHRRRQPAEHNFTQSALYAWLDADDPGRLAPRTPWFSDRRPAPLRFRRDDHLGGPVESVGSAVRSLIDDEVGSRPAGPVRSLTQLRTWGWLFNPITVHFAWNDPDTSPVAAVVEVTNTPWKERHRYVVGLGGDGSTVEAHFGKELHVSPFLPLGLEYRVRASIEGRRHRLLVDVYGSDDSEPVLSTGLTAPAVAADGRAIRRALGRVPLSTHRVSAGIHLQALQLWRKRVSFVAHPDRLRGEVAA